MTKLFTHVDPENDKVITDGDDILYLLLLEHHLKYDDNEENYRDWLFIKGRQSAYDHIRSILLEEDDSPVDSILDIDASLIYADNPHIPVESNKLRLSNGISIYKFMKDCYVLQKVKDEGGFDIEEFHMGELDQEQ